MKTIMIIAAMLFCFSCATPPQRPNITQMALDSLNHRGMTAEQVNQTFSDYDKARAEYEQTASYKSIPYLLAPLLIVGGAANGLLYDGAPRYGSIYGTGGYGYPGNPVVVTNPTGCR